MTKILKVFCILFLTCQYLFADPTSLIRNNLIMSSGTIINDGLSPGLSTPVPDNIAYTTYLDYLVQQALSIESDMGTINIVLKPSRSFKTGPWQGTPFSIDLKNYYPGVKGLPSEISSGTGSDSQKNAYSHLQLGVSSLGSSIWMLFDNDIVRIDAYRNLNKLLEPSNPIPLGLNIKKGASKAADIKIGTGFYPIDKYQYSGKTDKPPIVVNHLSGTAAQVIFGGTTTSTLISGAGVQVNGTMNVTGRIFGKIGELIQFNKNMGVVMNSSTYSYDSVGGKDGVAANGHRVTFPLRLNITKEIVSGTQTMSNWHNSNELGWPDSDCDYDATSLSASLKGFLITEAVCNINDSSYELVHMRTLVEEYTDGGSNSFSASPFSVFEFGPGNPDQTLVNLYPLVFTPGKKYRFYIQFLKWNDRDGALTSYSGYDLRVSSAKCIAYVIPAP